MHFLFTGCCQRLYRKRLNLNDAGWNFAGILLQLPSEISISVKLRITLGQPNTPLKPRIYCTTSGAGSMEIRVLKGEHQVPWMALDFQRLGSR